MIREVVISVPTPLPVGGRLGIDPVQLDSAIVFDLMTALVQPTVGLLLFVNSNAGKARIKPVIVESLPLLAWSLAVLAILLPLTPPGCWGTQPH